MDALAEPLALSVVGQQGIVVVVGLGLPVTLTLAWYHGEKGRQRVSGPELLIIATLLAIAAGLIGMWRREEAPETATRPGTAEPDPVRGVTGGAHRSSIAVLPFANLSADPDSTRHLSDGFHDDILTHLHRIGLEVRSRTSVMRYREVTRPLPEVARELGAGYLMEGTFRLSGGRLRITAQLIDAAADTHVWAETYDRAFTAEELFDTQSEIARRIAGALGAELTPENVRILDERPTLDVVAWSLGGLGVHLWQTAVDSAGFAHSVEAFERAIGLDSAYAAPWVGLSIVHEFAAANGFFEADPSFRAARHAANRAFSLDPAGEYEFGAFRASARSQLALIRFRYDRDFEGARRDFEALAADGGDVGPYFLLLSALGEHEAAERLIGARVRDDPASAFYRWDLAWVLYRARQFERSVAELAITAELDPERSARVAAISGQALVAAGRLDDGLESLRQVSSVSDPSGSGRALLVWALGRAGLQDEAGEQLEALLAESPRGPTDRVALAAAYVGVGNLDRAMELLESAAEDRNGAVLFLGQDPTFDELREDDRFTRLLERIGIPEASRVQLD
jgi:TolB-like protein